MRANQSLYLAVFMEPRAWGKRRQDKLVCGWIRRASWPYALQSDNRRVGYGRMAGQGRSGAEADYLM